MKLWLALLGTLPFLALVSGAAGDVGSAVEPSGLISVRGDRGIYLIDPRTSATRLVPGTAKADDYEWSPDGRMLVFDTGEDEGWNDKGSPDVYVVRADGGKPRLVLRNAWSPSWSPDGKRLVVFHGIESVMPGSWNLWSYTNWNVAIYTVGADGRDLRRLTSFTEPGYDFFAVSPHGKSIAYHGFGINRVGLDGDGRRLLVDGDSVSELAWSPDGEWLAFVRGEDEAYRVRSDGSGLSRLAKADFLENLAWSPDGSVIAFDRWAGGPSRTQATLLDVQTGKQRDLTRKPMESFAPAWSPDGRQLVFLTCACASWAGDDPALTGELWVTNADGTNPHRLVKGSWGWPSWGRAVPMSPAFAGR